MALEVGSLSSKQMALGSPSGAEQQSCSGFSLFPALFEGNCVKLGSSVST